MSQKTNELDTDILSMGIEDLRKEVLKLRNAIREHRDSSGHDLCWYVPELWSVLPERVDPKPQIPPTDEFLQKCAAYRKSLD